MLAIAVQTCGADVSLSQDMRLPQQIRRQLTYGVQQLDIH